MTYWLIHLSHNVLQKFTIATDSIQSFPGLSGLFFYQKIKIYIFKEFFYMYFILSEPALRIGVAQELMQSKPMSRKTYFS